MIGIIRSILPNLDDTSFLSKKIMEIIDILKNKISELNNINGNGFNISEEDLYKNLRRNDFKNIKALIRNMIPFIDDIDFIKIERISDIKKYCAYRYKNESLHIYKYINNFIKHFKKTVDDYLDRLYVNFDTVYPASPDDGTKSVLRFDNPSRFDYVNYKYYFDGKKYGKRVYKIQDMSKLNAMNWIYQLLFFCNLSNNQVMFITGSTGAGKSSQIPKLLSYMMYIKKNKKGSKILVSQPRITVITNVVNGLIRNMGFEEKTSHIQYKTSGPSYEKIEFGNVIKVVTDGILINYISGDEYKLHDVFVIDEVHEHNPNMDMSITLLRDKIKNNNKKLILISATMSDDEKRFNDYFRFASSWRLDKRFHIGSKTLNEIREHDIYFKKYVSDEMMSGIFASNKLSDEYLSMLLSVCEEIIMNSKKNGLLFLTGESDIKYVVSELNKRNLPSLCIPYFGSLIKNVSNWNNYVDYFLNTDGLKYEDPKYILESMLSNMNLEQFRKRVVGVSRVFIIATDVAEASITIKNLKYLIDTGFKKVNKYVGGINRLILTRIANTNRIQRRGRVGRTSDGDVYYLYDKNKLNTLSYQIENESIDNIILRLLMMDFKKNNLYRNKKGFIYDDDRIYYLIHPNDRNKIKKTLEKLIHYGMIDKNLEFTYFGRLSKELFSLDILLNYEFNELIGLFYAYVNDFLYEFYYILLFSNHLNTWYIKKLSYLGDESDYMNIYKYMLLFEGKYKKLFYYKLKHGEKTVLFKRNVKKFALRYNLNPSIKYNKILKYERDNILDDVDLKLVGGILKAYNENKKSLKTMMDDLYLTVDLSKYVFGINVKKDLLNKLISMTFGYNRLNTLNKDIEYKTSLKTIPRSLIYKNYIEDDGVKKVNLISVIY